MVPQGKEVIEGIKSRIDEHREDLAFLESMEDAMEDTKKHIQKALASSTANGEDINEQISKLECLIDDSAKDILFNEYTKLRQHVFPAEESPNGDTSEGHDNVFDGNTGETDNLQDLALCISLLKVMSLLFTNVKKRSEELEAIEPDKSQAKVLELVVKASGMTDVSLGDGDVGESPDLSVQGLKGNIEALIASCVETSRQVRAMSIP